MFEKGIHERIYFYGTVLLGIGLPVSLFLVSVAILVLVINWLIEGKFRAKFQNLFKRKSVLIFISIYVVHLIGLAYTKNFEYALHDIRIKLPLLALPVIYGTIPVFSSKKIKLVLQLFIATVLVASFISSYILLDFSKLNIIDPRDASMFISHIRFSLMVVLSIYIGLYYLVFDSNSGTLTHRMVYMAVIVWLMFFLVIFKSFTGIVILCMLPALVLLWWFHNNKSRKNFWISVGVLSFLIAGILFYSIYALNKFQHQPETYSKPYDTHTVNGNSYIHDTTSTDNENRHKLWIYICDKELAKEWNARSSYHYYNYDRKGQLLRGTLLRYMSSMGLRKDSVGVSMLSDEDIKYIENGYTNYIYKNRFSLYPRIHNILWELEQYRLTGDPSGGSLSQRVEYVKTGWGIFKRYKWFGTGTGDIDDEFKTQYVLDDSKLKPKWQHRTHNQYLTFMCTFGIFGFIWILYATVYPPSFEKKYGNYFFLVFFVIGLLSMLNEDTLETHIGVSFFAFFYSFLLYAYPSETNDS